MRFLKKSQEQRFKMDVEERLLKTLLVASFTSAVLLLIHMMIRADALQDSILRSNISMCFLSIAIASAVAMRVKLKWLRRLDWELVALCYSVVLTASLFCMSDWYASAVFGDMRTVEDHLEGMLTVVVLLTVVSFVCVYLPIRMCLLPLQPIFAFIAFVTLSGMRQALASHFKCSVPLVGLFCLSAIAGAQKREHYVRKSWLTGLQEHEHVKENDLLESAWQLLAGAQCDVVLELNKNLQIPFSDRLHDSFFEQRIGNQYLENIIHRDDQRYFRDLVDEARRTSSPLYMPATIVSLPRTFRVQLTIVHTGAARVKFLIGFHSRDPDSELVERFPTLLTSAAKDLQDKPWLDRQLHSDIQIMSSEVQKLYSTCSETVFGCGAWSDHTSKHLELILQQGLKEHWLIQPSDVRILPKQILGSGGFGVVVAGLLRGTPVALKMAKNRSADSKHGGANLNVLSTLANELRTLRHIRHPNMVLFFGACVDPSASELALIYELLDGTVLQDYVVDNLNEEFAPCLWKILQDISCALAYLHTHRPVIAHGDLKGSNVMVICGTQGPVAKLLDFGLSQILTGNAKLMGGTMGWTAPELLFKQQHAPSPSTDVFSFGHVVHLTTTGLPRPIGIKYDVGRNPFHQLTWPQSSPFRNVAALLCKECLSYDPQARPSMEHIQTELQEWRSKGPDKDFMCHAKNEEILPWSDALLRLRSEVSCSTPSSRRASKERALPKRPKNDEIPQADWLSMCVQGCVPTPRETKHLAMMMTLNAWSCSVKESSCCTYHSVIDDAERVLHDMKHMMCRWLDYNQMWQCSCCGALSTHGSDECCVCCESRNLDSACSGSTCL